MPCLQMCCHALPCMHQQGLARTATNAWLIKAVTGSCWLLPPLTPYCPPSGLRRLDLIAVTDDAVTGTWHLPPLAPPSPHSHCPPD